MEYKLDVSIDVLDALNRVFREALTCESEEELPHLLGGEIKAESEFGEGKHLHYEVAHPLRGGRVEWKRKAASSSSTTIPACAGPCPSS